MAGSRIDWARAQTRTRVLIRGSESYRPETFPGRASRDELAHADRVPRVEPFLRNALRLKKRLEELSAVASKKSSFNRARRLAVGIRNEVKHGLAEDKRAALERPDLQTAELIEKFHTEVRGLLWRLEQSGVVASRADIASRSKPTREGHKKKRAATKGR